MSRQDEKDRRNQRLHDEETAIKRQVKIAKSHGLTNSDKHIKEPHRHAKHHAMDCGQPGCMLCGNPRKIFNEITKQEKSFNQTSKWTDDELND